MGSKFKKNVQDVFGHVLQTVSGNGFLFFKIKNNFRILKTYLVKFQSKIVFNAENNFMI